VPYDTGPCAGPGASRCPTARPTLEWGGTEDTSRYARRQYYDGSLHHTTAGTCSHWAAAAAAVRGTNLGCHVQVRDGRRQVTDVTQEVESWVEGILSPSP